MGVPLWRKLKHSIDGYQKCLKKCTPYLYERNQYLKTKWFCTKLFYGLMQFTSIFQLFKKWNLTDYFLYGLAHYQNLGAGEKNAESQALFQIYWNHPDHRCFTWTLKLEEPQFFRNLKITKLVKEQK